MSTIWTEKTLDLDSVGRAYCSTVQTSEGQPIFGKQGATIMFKFYRHYIRYAVAALATVGFGITLN